MKKNYFWRTWAVVMLVSLFGGLAVEAYGLVGHAVAGYMITVADVAWNFFRNTLGPGLIALSVGFFLGRFVR